MSLIVKFYNYMLNHPKTKRGYWGVWYFSKRYTQSLAELTKFKPDFLSFLELGCGKGLYAFHLTKLKPDCEYVGCDLDKTALRHAFKHKKLNYIQCDVHHLPLRGNIVDVVLCSEVLEHVTSPYDVVGSIVDLARETVLVTFPIEHLGKKIHARHPEHINDINLQKVNNRLTAKHFTILKAGEVSRFFIPCGILEFLKIPKNRFTMLFVTFVDNVFGKLLPIAFVPDQTILVVASKR